MAWVDSILTPSVFRSRFKIIFLTKLGVGPTFQALDMLLYACGLKLGPALILNQNLNLETASITFIQHLQRPGDYRRSASAQGD